MIDDIFSPTERRVLSLVLRRKTPVTIAELTEKFHGGHAPLEANNRIAAAVRRINAKCEHHDLDWFLNGAGMGRAGKTIWKDKRA